MITSKLEGGKQEMGINKLILKFPMQNIVVADDYTVWDYRIFNKKVTYRYLYSTGRIK